jgi:hypothetical protein
MYRTTTLALTAALSAVAFSTATQAHFTPIPGRVPISITAVPRAPAPVSIPHRVPATHVIHGTGGRRPIPIDAGAKGKTDLKNVSHAVKEIRHDKAEIRLDKANLRHAKGEVTHDLIKLNRDKAKGDVKAVNNDRKVLREDNREVRRDRNTLRADNRELRHDEIKLGKNL